MDEVLKKRRVAYTLKYAHSPKGKRTLQKYRKSKRGRTMINASRQKSYFKDPVPNLFLGAKHRAKKKNLPFNIEREDIVIPEFCPVLGIPIFSTRRGEKRDNSPSLDRIIPELGYVKGNIAVISYKANAMKQNATWEELEKLTNWVKAQTKT